MSDDLISRQAVIEHLSKRLYETALNNVDKSEVYTDIAENRLTVWVDELPSVQPKGKTGHWIEQEDYGEIYYCCTICGEPYVTIEGTPKDNQMNYCPCCGAKMEGME